MEVYRPEFFKTKGKGVLLLSQSPTGFYIGSEARLCHLLVSLGKLPSMPEFLPLEKEGESSSCPIRPKRDHTVNTCLLSFFISQYAMLTLGVVYY